MKTTKGFIFTYSEIEYLNEDGYLTDLQLLDDNGGEPYGNCIIVAANSFTEEEINCLGLTDCILDVYYTQDFSDEKAELEYEGEWYAKGCTGEAFFVEDADYLLATEN